MQVSLNPSEESSNHKLALAFDDAERAEDARRRLDASGATAMANTRLLTPQSATIGRKVLPESGRIWKTWLKSHAVFGLAGALVGVSVYLGLAWQGVRFVDSSPLLSAFASIHVCTMLGLLLGGLFALRPDQALFVHRVRDALQQGRSVLIVHAESKEQQRRARLALADRATQVFASA